MRWNLDIHTTQVSSTNQFTVVSFWNQIEKFRLDFREDFIPNHRHYNIYKINQRNVTALHPRANDFTAFTHLPCLYIKKANTNPNPSLRHHPKESPRTEEGRGASPHFPFLLRSHGFSVIHQIKSTGFLSPQNYVPYPTVRFTLSSFCVFVFFFFRTK